MPGEAQNRQTASAAIRAAEDMARRFCGAVAFSRTGDPASGEFADAVLLKSFGEVPSFETSNLAFKDLALITTKLPV